jgi:hypothetical protein
VFLAVDRALTASLGDAREVGFNKYLKNTCMLQVLKVSGQKVNSDEN